MSIANACYGKKPSLGLGFAACVIVTQRLRTISLRYPVSKKSICSTCQHASFVAERTIECAKSNEACHLAMGRIVACPMYEHKNRQVVAQRSWFDSLRGIVRVVER